MQMEKYVHFLCKWMKGHISETRSDITSKTHLSPHCRIPRIASTSDRQTPPASNMKLYIKPSVCPTLSQYVLTPYLRRSSPHIFPSFPSIPPLNLFKDQLVKNFLNLRMFWFLDLLTPRFMEPAGSILELDWSSSPIIPIFSRINPTSQTDAFQRCPPSTPLPS